MVINLCCSQFIAPAIEIKVQIPYLGIANGKICMNLGQYDRNIIQGTIVCNISIYERANSFQISCNE